jgi:cbb3-type cytochrome oxidase subunit 3
MDINVVRILVTVGALAAYLIIVWYAYLPGRKQHLDAEARRILDEADR